MSYLNCLTTHCSGPSPRRVWSAELGPLGKEFRPSVTVLLIKDGLSNGGPISKVVFQTPCLGARHHDCSCISCRVNRNYAWKLVNPVFGGIHTARASWFKTPPQCGGAQCVHSWHVRRFPRRVGGHRIGEETRRVARLAGRAVTSSESEPKPRNETSEEISASLLGGQTVDPQRSDTRASRVKSQKALGLQQRIGSPNTSFQRTQVRALRGLGPLNSDR